MARIAKSKSYPQGGEKAKLVEIMQRFQVVIGRARLWLASILASNINLISDRALQSVLQGPSILDLPPIAPCL